jgi:uncharacterized protein YndB with AHSA1/START domain
MVSSRAGSSSAHVRTSTTASPDRVWALLVDGPSWTQWAGFDEVEYEREGTPAPHGLGAVRRIRVGRLRSTETVLAFEPPHRFAYDYIGTLPFKQYRAEVTLTPNGTGTLIDWESRFTAKYPLTTGVLRRVVTTAAEHPGP